VYLVVTMPSVTGLGLVLRYIKRKRLHRRRAMGQCMSTVVAVGYEPAVADLVNELRRGSHPGAERGGACPGGGGPGGDKGGRGAGFWRRGRRGGGRGGAPERRRHGRGLVLPGDRRGNAASTCLGAGEDRRRPVRRPGAA